MPISKRFILSILSLFVMIWGGLTQQLSYANVNLAEHECVLITFESSPRVLLNAKTGEYFTMPYPERTDLASYAPWMNQVSPDNKKIVYLQPSLENPLGRSFDLFVEDLATGLRHRVAQDVAYTPPTSMGDTYVLDWSHDSQLIAFFHQGFIWPSYEGFGFVFTASGRILERWEGRLYSQQWSPNNRYLIFGHNDPATKSTAISVWDHETNQTTSYDLGADHTVKDINWASTSDKAVILESQLQPLNQEPPTNQIYSLTVGQVSLQSLPFQLRQETINNTVNTVFLFDWEFDDQSIEFRYFVDHDKSRLQTLDPNTKTLISVTTLAQPTTPGNTLLGDKFYWQWNTYGTIIEIPLHYEPQHIVARFATEETVYFPYWKIKTISSAILVGEARQHIFVTLHDFSTHESITHELPFSHWQNIQIEQIRGTELLSYRFDDKVFSHTGIFNARTGNIVLEFTDVPEEVPVFHKSQYYRDKTGIVEFVQEDISDYFTLEGEHFLHVSPMLDLHGAPDGNALIGIEARPMEGGYTTSYLWFFNSSESHRIEINNDELYYESIIDWSPTGDYVLVGSSGFVYTLSQSGAVFWKFPPFGLTNYYGEPVYDWVRCDTFLRWGDIEIESVGQAEKGEI